MYKSIWLLLLLCLLISCKSNDDYKKREYKSIAEKFIRGEYCCNPNVVDELGADSIFVTYPIFQKLFGKSAIRGKESARSFAETFCKRWAEAQITIHNAVAEGNEVVLVWSFSARNIGSSLLDIEPDSLIHSWGGITLFLFNKDDKIIAEIGEERTPGPFARSNVQLK